MGPRVTSEALDERDLDWAWEVYQATTREQNDATVDWTPEEHRERRLAGLRDGTFRALLVDGARVGLVAVHESDRDLDIRHLEVLPEHQGRGIGSATIEDVLTRARDTGRAVTLRVLHANPRARDLYLRLGFEVESVRSGSTQLRLDPARRPTPRR